MWPILATLIVVAGAPTPPPDLIWEAPSGCPPASIVVGNVERILAESARPRTGVHAAARVVVSYGEAWQASVILEVDGRATERHFEAESCDAIATATALILALAADEGLAALAEPSAPVAKREPPPFEPSIAASPSAPVLSTAARAPAPRREPVQRSMLASADGLVDWGTLPAGAAAGVEAGLGLRWKRGRWRAGSLGGADFFPSQHLAYSPTGGYIFADFWLAGAFARGCVAVAVGRVELGPCLGGELEVMHGSASASNPGAVKTQTRAWFSAQGSAVASVKLARATALSLRAGLSVPTTHPNFGTPNVDVIVHQVPAVTYRAALGIEQRF